MTRLGATARVVVTITVLVACRGPSAAPVTETGVAPAPCPTTDPAWAAWARQEARALVAPSHVRDDTRYLHGEVLAARARDLHERLEGCAATQPLPARLDNLRAFAAALRWTAYPGHGFGYAIDDDAFVAERRDDLTLPPLLRYQEFLAAVSDPARYGDALAMIEQANAARPPELRWVTLLYRSRFLKTPEDSTYGRFFVLVPGNPERWIQFGIDVPGEQPHGTIRNVSVVAIRRAGDRYVASLLDWYRSFGPDGIELVPRIQEGHGTSNCYGCHKTPVLPIHPLAEYTIGDGGRLVEKRDGAGEVAARLNDKIAGYGAADFGDLLDVRAYGPPLGSADRPRSDAFLRRCTEPFDLSPPSVRRVRDHMICSDCHDWHDMGAINVPQAIATNQDTDHLRHPETGASMPIPITFVERGWMPPDNQLTPPERRALARCLTLEYYDPVSGSGVLIDWLAGE